jgi:hypothetical protein
MLHTPVAAGRPTKRSGLFCGINVCYYIKDRPNHKLFLSKASKNVQDLPGRRMFVGPQDTGAGAER